MASTNAKPGFRLPWSADRGETESPADVPTADPSTGDPATQAQENETPDMIDAAPPASDQSAAVDAEAAVAPSPSNVVAPAVDDAPPAGAAARKPNKFMADLTKAMQVAAETARSDTLSRFASEAKAHIESIHASTATEATELRKKADDDVAAIREWSKTEIARIREETDERIAHRKTVLEREVEVHAAGIDARIERVQGRVDAFEAEMAAFFERLMAEPDPTHFASLAESLPEPPPFDPDQAWEPSALIGDTYEAQSVDPSPEAASDGPTEAARHETDDVAAEHVVDAPTDGVAETTTDVHADATADGLGETDPAAAYGTAEPSLNETANEGAGDLFSIGTDDPSAASEVDPRLSALGINADFAAAEAEAAELTADAPTSDEEIPVIADDALAARLAGLVPDADTGTHESASTRAVVTGLVSVASIAGFKRHLSRLNGVHSVGVSSGPDGEFVFAIVHDAGLALSNAITTLPGFSARVTNESDGELTVAARDPETEG